MLSRLRQLNIFSKPTTADFNKVVERLNLLSNVHGGNGIGIKTNPAGINIYNTSKFIGVRRAFVKTTPAAVATVVCFLDVDAADAEITVNCDIVGGTALNSALPRITDGDAITVYQINGTWYCTTIFQESEDCVCS